MANAPFTASLEQKTVFGHDVKLDPICGFPIEQGSGALPLTQQRQNYLQTLPQAQADALRRELGWPLPSEVAAAAAAKAAAEAAHKQEAEAAFAKVPELQAQIGALQAEIAAVKAAVTQSSEPTPKPTEH